jgi:hypothetical protein
VGHRRNAERKNRIGAIERSWAAVESPPRIAGRGLRAGARRLPPGDQVGQDRLVGDGDRLARHALVDDAVARDARRRADRLDADDDRLVALRALEDLEVDLRHGTEPRAEDRRRPRPRLIHGERRAGERPVARSVARGPEQHEAADDVAHARPGLRERLRARLLALGLPRQALFGRLGQERFDVADVKRLPRRPEDRFHGRGCSHRGRTDSVGYVRRSASRARPRATARPCRRSPEEVVSAVDLVQALGVRVEGGEALGRGVRDEQGEHEVVLGLAAVGAPGPRRRPSAFRRRFRRRVGRRG